MFYSSVLQLLLLEPRGEDMSKGTSRQPPEVRGLLGNGLALPLLLRSSSSASFLKTSAPSLYSSVVKNHPTAEANRGRFVVDEEVVSSSVLLTQSGHEIPSEDLIQQVAVKYEVAHPHDFPFNVRVEALRLLFGNDPPRTEDGSESVREKQEETRRKTRSGRGKGRM